MYEKDISIDETALDIEWLRQSDLMRQYGQKVAELRLEMDQASEIVDIIYAELDKKIRDKPEDFNLGKITEGIVKSTITDHEDHKDAKRKFLKARYEYEMAKAAVTALEHKKEALKNLVILHGQQYFAGPTVPRILDEERQSFEERETKANTQSNKKIKLKRTK